MLLILTAAFATGLLSKFVDLVEEHGLDASRTLSGAAGIMYGVLIAFVISASPELSSLWIATVVSVMITGKIDTAGHCLAVGSALFMFPVLGIAGISLSFLAIFTIIGILDEAVNDMLVDKGRIRNHVLRSFLATRPLLEIAAFATSLFTGLWLIWLGLLVYDMGYVLTEYVGDSD